MKHKIDKLSKEIQDDVIKFTQQLIRTKSYTGQEEELANIVKNKMIELDYDEIILDKLGNVIGRIGNGDIKIMYDSHMDTVEVKDIDKWTVDPFGGEIKDGKLYGRGSVDMKAGIASTIYAGNAMKKLGLAKDKTIYISISVMEEDYDGEAVTYMIENNNICPDYVIICEPTNLQIGTGHRGRAMLEISIDGISVHGSAPEKGLNPIYKMNKIIKRVEKLNEEFLLREDTGSICITKIESKSASLNAVPNLCTIYIDRRLEIGENKEFIEKEMEYLTQGIKANYKIYTAEGTSWTGEKVISHSFFPAWEIAKEHELVTSSIKTFRDLNGYEPRIAKMEFSTNGVSTSGKFNIPTIVFGAGDVKMAHMIDEFCPINDIINAFKFYTLLPQNIKK